MSQQYLKSKKLAGQIVEVMSGRTEGRLDEVDRWIAEESSGEALDILMSDEALSRAVGSFDRPEKEEAGRSLICRIARRRRMRLVRRWSAAASIAAAVLAAFSLWNSPEPILVSSSGFDSGYTSPVLILASGGNIDLDSLGTDGTVPGASVAKRGEREISLGSTETARIEYNTLVIPNGCSYCVQLPDGTTVWLNACSKLHYPSRFEPGAERTVMLEGEGYFEVGRTGDPFVVKAGGVDVRVYGTQFNVKYCSGESLVSTVLVEGSVGVRPAGRADIPEVMLRPNQRAQISAADPTARIDDVDAYRHIAWVKGYFIFENMTLYDITVELSKWYDVDFYIDRDIADENIMASFDKKLDIDDILSMLGNISKARFRRDGRCIHIE